MCYCLINAWATIANLANALQGNNHVPEYDWLLANARCRVGGVPMVRDPGYQRRYALYWVFQGVDAHWRAVYFQELGNALFGQPPGLRSLLNTLYNTRSYVANGTSDSKLHFVFATKLLHTVTPNLPIYDNRTRDFYRFTLPPAKKPINSRIDTCVRFYEGPLPQYREFLINEFARILNHGILANAIQAFRQGFNPQHFTDEKIIDSLIWTFVGVQQGMKQLPYNPNNPRSGQCPQCGWRPWPWP